MKLKYIGGGAFLDVPARDLSEEDLKHLPEHLTVETLIVSGLYKAETFDAVDAEKILPHVKKPKKEGE